MPEVDSPASLPAEIVSLQLQSAASHIDAADLALEDAGIAAVIGAGAGTSSTRSIPSCAT